MMLTDGMRLLFRLGRGVQYRTLPGLVGQRIRIESLATIETTLHELVGAWQPAAATGVRPGDVERRLAKSGVIDAELSAPRALLDHPDVRAGIPLLRELGFLPERGDILEIQEGFDDDPLCLLKQLADDFDAQGCVLKVRLDDGIKFADRIKMKDFSVNRLSADYLPRDLVVTDACVTNARSAWFLKHFYM